MLVKGYLEMPIEADETFLDALHRGIRSVSTGKKPRSTLVRILRKLSSDIGKRLNRIQRDMIQSTFMCQTIMNEVP